MEKVIVTEAARNFADCVNRAHYQEITFVLLKDGSPVARIVPDREKVCTGADLASVVSKLQLSPKEARDWARDLNKGRRQIKAISDKWR